MKFTSMKEKRSIDLCGVPPSSSMLPRHSACAASLQALPWCLEAVAAVAAFAARRLWPRPRRGCGSASGATQHTRSCTQPGMLGTLAGRSPALFHAHEATATTLFGRRPRVKAIACPNGRKRDRRRLSSRHCFLWRCFLFAIARLAFSPLATARRSFVSCVCAQHHTGIPSPLAR